VSVFSRFEPFFDDFAGEASDDILVDAAREANTKLKRWKCRKQHRFGGNFGSAQQAAA
jgi:hypothetical protein